MRVKAWEPFRHVWSDWRGGQINSLGATATIKLHAEHNIIRTYTSVSNGLLPAGAVVGDAVMCRVTGSYPYTIAEIRSTRFAPAHRRIRRRRWRGASSGPASSSTRSATKLTIGGFSSNPRFDIWGSLTTT